MLTIDRRKLVTLLIAVALLAGCTTQVHTGIVSESDGGGHAVVTTMRDGQVEVTGVQSKLVTTSQSSSAGVLDFQASAFKPTTKHPQCSAGPCWQLFVYDEGEARIAQDVIARFADKLPAALNALPDTLRGRPPFVLKIYLVPPSRAFNATYKVVGRAQRAFAIAVHLDSELPSSRRQQRAFDEREANAVRTIVHEFIHFASLQNGWYQNGWHDVASQLASASHMEALAKCYDNWAFLTTLDAHAQVQHVILFAPLARPTQGMHALNGAHGQATEYLGRHIQQSFAAIQSPTLFENHVLLSASDVQERELLLEICRELTQVRELQF